MTMDELAILIEKNRDAAWSFAYTGCALFDKDLADEIYQTAVLKIIKSESYKPEKVKFITYFCTVIRNTATDMHRKRISRGHLHKQDLNVDVGDGEIDNVAILGVDHNHGGDTYDCERIMERVRDLPTRCQAAMLMRLEGHSYADIADKLGLSLGAVKSHLFRGKVILEKTLKKVA